MKHVCRRKVEIRTEASVRKMLVHYGAVLGSIENTGWSRMVIIEYRHQVSFVTHWALSLKHTKKLIYRKN